MKVLSVVTPTGFGRAGDTMLPEHLYRCCKDVLSGLNRKIAEETLSLLETVVSCVMTMLFESSHAAVGMLVRPEMTSDTVQVRSNTDPATGLPDRLMVTEMELSGTIMAHFRSQPKFLQQF